MSEKLLQQKINEKVTQTEKTMANGSGIIFINVSIDRLNLRAKNYSKQEKIILDPDDSREADEDDKVGLEPYVALLARIWTDSQEDVETGEQWAFVS